MVHRDLKPANILLKNGVCKISDFGFARNLERGANTILNSVVGTPLYMSPQILSHMKYTAKSDLWSVGLIFYQLLHGHTPWTADNEGDLLRNILSKRFVFG
jgi:serine/threonine protein kinase